ncbi:MAG: CapA family protein [Caldilineales bacterium]|nr:CapA family protein [Caldilineales bacterium]
MKHLSIRTIAVFVAALAVMALALPLLAAGPPIRVYLASGLNPAQAERLGDALAGADVDGRVVELVDSAAASSVIIDYGPVADADAILTERIYAVVAPFATVRDEISGEELQARWSGEDDRPLFVASENVAELAAVLGPANPSIPAAGLPDDLGGDADALAIIPFDELNPTYKVLAVDGRNPLHKDFDASDYPLAVALSVGGDDAEALASLLTGLFPASNRDPDRLTTLVMTGVTAMSRVTAQRMERRGYDYPARVIGGELSAADITHVSNEVPFIPGCKVNASANNLRFCSDTSYWQALADIGTDIVGLSGNHVNDFGRNGARKSLAFYEDTGVPVYGSGLDEEAACAPLILEHNGNTIAFIAALAYAPSSAWATADQPGACYYYRNKKAILDTVSELSEKVDIVAVELQHTETYRARPIPKQVREFRELREAGADIVTGVQSHVPQAMEPDEDGIIVYGLGNLFFDQMWSWPTRTGLIARHTLYDGRPLNTEILTTVLMDYAQPRWATPKERAGILRRIFNAAPQ